MADPVAEVLAEHQEQANNDGTIQCQCGRFETTYPSRMAAHQAEMLRAAGLVASEEREPSRRMVDNRLPECVERWPGCASGEHDPRCCRFPKSCSAGVTAWVPADEGSEG